MKPTPVKDSFAARERYPYVCYSREVPVCTRGHNRLWFLSIPIGHFQVTLCLCFKTSPLAKPFKWKWIWFTWNEPLGGTHFHMNGLVLTEDSFWHRKCPRLTHLHNNISSLRFHWLLKRASLLFSCTFNFEERQYYKFISYILFMLGVCSSICRSSC